MHTAMAQEPVANIPAEMVVDTSGADDAGGATEPEAAPSAMEVDEPAEAPADDSAAVETSPTPGLSDAGVGGEGDAVEAMVPEEGAGDTSESIDPAPVAQHENTGTAAPAGGEEMQT